MPSAPPRRCCSCKALGEWRRGRCPACEARRLAAYRSDDGRPSFRRRGYGRRHLYFRREVLRRDPVCVLCHAAASVVADHWPVSRRDLVSAGADPDDPRHGRGLCRGCDSRQTAARQPGGWNRR